jgi:hypothetical protein
MCTLPSILLLLFRGQEYLVNFIDKQPIMVQGTDDEPQHKNNNFADEIIHLLMKNSLFTRLNLPQRYVGIVKVDIFALKEILAVSGELQSPLVETAISATKVSAAASVSHQSSNNSKGLFSGWFSAASSHGSSLVPTPVSSASSQSKPSSSSRAKGIVVVPSITHTPGQNIEVYCAIRLVNQQQPLALRSYDRSQTFGSGASTATSIKGFLDGTFLASPRKIDILTTMNNTKTGSAQKNDDKAPSATFSSRNSKAILSQINQSIDYDFRQQCHFQIPLPDYVTFGTTSPTSSSRPPKGIQVQVFEKQFFGDSKLGEITIPLEFLSQSR